MKINPKILYIASSIGVIILLVLGFVFGVIHTKSKTNEQIIVSDISSYESGNPTNNPNETENVISQNVVTDAVLIQKTKYTKCNHTLIQSSQVPEDIKKLGKEQFKALYSEWNVENYTPSEIIISRSINKKCPEHYVLNIKNGKVAVYYQTPVEGVYLKELTNIEVVNLTKADQIRLNQGILIDGNQKLAEILEDLGS